MTDNTYVEMVIDNLTSQLPALIIAARGWDPYMVDSRDMAMRKIAWIDRQILAIAQEVKA